MSQPLILAFDTSGPHCAVALCMGRRVLASRFEAMTKGQAERLMPLVEETMGDDGLTLDTLDAIAVGIGPGNFTGIRIAVSAARGLGLALGIPVIGISNFEVMRGPASHRDAGRQLVSLRGVKDSLFLQMFTGGRAEGAPQMMPNLQTPYWEMFEGTATTPVLGHRADDLALVHPPSYEPSGPQAIRAEIDTRGCAVTIAAIAADKLAQTHDHPRPAPLYIKPADAAPSREQGPVML